MLLPASYQCRVSVFSRLHMCSFTLWLLCLLGSGSSLDVLKLRTFSQSLVGVYLWGGSPEEGTFGIGFWLQLPLTDARTRHCRGLWLTRNRGTLKTGSRELCLTGSGAVWLTGSRGPWILVGREVGVPGRPELVDLVWLEEDVFGGREKELLDWQEVEALTLRALPHPKCRHLAGSSHHPTRSRGPWLTRTKGPWHDVAVMKTSGVESFW